MAFALGAALPVMESKSLDVAHNPYGAVMTQVREVLNTVKARQLSAESLDNAVILRSAGYVADSLLDNPQGVKVLVAPEKSGSGPIYSSVYCSVTPAEGVLADISQFEHGVVEMELRSTSADMDYRVGDVASTVMINLRNRTVQIGRVKGNTQSFV